MSNKKNLIVDDDDFVRNLMDKIIKSAGYETQLCADGEEAFNVLRKGEIDLVITDINMPKKDGIQLLNDIRAENLSTPVLAFSGDSKNPDHYVAFGCHYAADILEKPIKKESLLDLIEQVLKHP